MMMRRAITEEETKTVRASPLPPPPPPPPPPSLNQWCGVKGVTRWVRVGVWSERVSHLRAWTVDSWRCARPIDMCQHIRTM